jgi:hypothetical protein
MPRLALIFLLSALLSGCFASDKPMFTSETAVLALGEGGRYATFELIDGKEKPSDPIEVTAGPNNVYRFINQKGATNLVTFHPLSGDDHIAQVKLGGDSGYGYVIARLTGNGLCVIPTECDKQDAAKLAALGVVRRGQHECRIDQVADPAAFFAALERSESISRMVRE